MSDDDDGNLYQGYGSRPIPDPTLLTTAALTREITALRDSMSLNLKGEVAAITARLDAGDKATALLEKERDRQPAEIESRIRQHEAVEAERYNAILEKFVGVRAVQEERKIQAEKLADATDKALQAALAAAKEAVLTSTLTFKESIAKSEGTTSEMLSGLGAKISEQGDRLTRVESTAQGVAIAIGSGRAERVEKQGASSFTLAIIVAVSGILLGLVGAVTAFLGLVAAVAAIVIALAR